MGNDCCCCRRDRNNGAGDFLSDIFNGENTEILMFLIVFLLLFTTYGRR